MNRLDYYLAINHGYTHAVILGIPILILGLADDINETTKLISWFSIGGIMYGFGAIPSGWLATRNAYATLNGGLLLIIIGLLLAGVFDGKYIGPAFVIIGTGLSAYHPTGMAILAEIYPENIGKALARNGVGGNIGQAAGPVIAGTWVFLEPEKVFLIFAILGVLTMASGIGTVPSLTKSKAGDLKSILALFTTAIILLQITNVLSGLAFRGVVVMSPDEIDFFLQTTPEEAAKVSAIMISLASIAGIFGNLAVSNVIDKRGPPYVMFITSLFVLIGVILFSMALTEKIPGGLSLIALSMIIFGMATYGFQPASNTYLARQTEVGGRAALYGITFALRFGLSFGAPLMIVLLKDVEATIIMIGFASLALIASIAIARMR